MAVDERTEAAGTGVPSSGEQHRVVTALRWVFWRRLAYGGLVVALVFFCLSFVPSLMPRPWLLQGVVGGLTAVIGYGFGSAGSAIIRKFLAREPAARTKQLAWRGLGIATLVLVPLFVWLGAIWQEDARRLVEMDALGPQEWLGILVVAVIVFYLLLVLARTVRGMARGLIWLAERIMPRPVAIGIGIAVIVFLLVGMVGGFLTDTAYDVMNSIASVGNDSTSEGVVAPTTPLRSGSPESLVAWDGLGAKGRDFTGTGPTTAEIAAFAGSPTTEPIRVYVGLKSVDSVEERVQLAMDELERTGAFDRSVILLHTPSGNGEVIVAAAAAIEYMYGGDTAQVAIQYSYLPSFVSMFVNPDESVAHSSRLIRAIDERRRQLPEDQRPQFLLYGESLGAYGTEASFADLDEMLAYVDGVLLVGPTFLNTMRETFLEQRDSASPIWLAVYEDGETVRFATTPSDFPQTAEEWSQPRVAYLQNATDPVSWFEPELLFVPPEWLDDPRGPDVSPDMMWVPVVTAWQVVLDLTMGSSAPGGHGHRYGTNVVDGLVAISPPPGWTADDTARLRTIVEPEQ